MRAYLGGSLERVRLDDDGPDGLFLVVDCDEADVRVRVRYQDVAAIDAALEPLREQQRERDRQLAAYTAATPGQRAAVLGLDPDGGGYDPDDPKSAGWHDLAASIWDDRDKTERR